jgi:hypothetical protein
MRIPTKDELVDYDSLDDRTVVNHFLGRTADEAFEMFRTNASQYAEDFMWMAQRGLEYYLDPVCRYFQSCDSEGDWFFT